MSLPETGFGKTSWSAQPSRRMARERLLIVNGHPDPRSERFCAALCQACVAGATATGRDSDIIALGAVFTANGQGDCKELTKALDLLRHRARLTVIFPLWLDKPPEIVTRFFGLVERGGDTQAKSRHANLVVTMALPAFAHRSMVREQERRHIEHAMSLPGLKIDTLSFVGSIDTISRSQREEWLHRLRRLGSGRA